MKKSLSTIIAVAIIVSGLVGSKSFKKNHKSNISESTLANVEALTQDEVYKLKTCYSKVYFSDNSQLSFLECYSGTTNSLIYSCSGAKTVRGHLPESVNIYKCVE